MVPTNTRIYGEHDEKTIRQLDRCMQAGSALKGVLCADGHLGYAHPIGGVVAYLRQKGVFLRGGDVDESPMVYRRLEDVLAFHKNTIQIEHTLRPFAVAMAGPGEFDPYKD